MQHSKPSLDVLANTVPKAHHGWGGRGIQGLVCGRLQGCIQALQGGGAAGLHSNGALPDRVGGARLGNVSQIPKEHSTLAGGLGMLLQGAWRPCENPKPCRIDRT